MKQKYRYGGHDYAEKHYGQVAAIDILAGIHRFMALLVLMVFI